MTKFITTILLLFLLTGCTQIDSNEVWSGWNLGKQIPKHLKLKAPKEKILKHRIVKQEIKTPILGGTATTTEEQLFEVSYIDIVSYDYVSENKTDRNVYFKDGEKYSETVIAGKNNFHVFTGDHFSKETDGVYEIEHGATTTLETFKEQTKLSLVDKVKRLFTAHADELTPVYSGSGDDSALGDDTSSWQNQHDDTTGTVRGGDDMIIASHSNPYIQRASVPFDTSALPEGVVVSAVDLVVVAEAYYYDGGGNNLVITANTRSNPASAMINTDYNITNFGAEYASIDLTSWNVSATNTISFNATGKLAINDDGYTTIGIIISEDLDNNGGSTLNAVKITSSDFTGTGSDPYLSITYSEGGAEAEEDNSQVIGE